MTVPAPRAVGRPRDERATRAIEAAALRQLSVLGYARMTVESVAEEAGVARATLYRRYRDKADLVTSAIAAAAARSSGRRGASDPVEAVVRFLEEFDARIAEDCLEVVGCLLAERQEPNAMAEHRARVIDPTRGAARTLLERAQDAGALRRDADAGIVLEMLLGAVFARRIAGVPAEPGWARRAVETLLVGAAPRSSTARRAGSARATAPVGAASSS